MALKITGNMHSSSEQKIDYNDLYRQLSEKFSSLFMTQLEDTVFIYRALGRAEFRNLMSDKETSDFIKEEKLCSLCVLYPDNYNWANCSAGLPSLLAKDILEKSFLDSEESMTILKTYYRSEMYDVDNQITCIIQDAFPNFSLEEIETWNMERTMKYLSRAEWKLKNLKKIDVSSGTTQYQALPSQRVSKNNVLSKKETAIRGGSKKSKLTPEKAREKAEFLKKFPQFAGHDDGEDGIEGLAQAGVDTTPPALRVGW